MEIDFDKPYTFYKTFNKTGLILDDLYAYRVGIISDCNDNIEENINSNGVILNNQVTIGKTIDLVLEWNNNSFELSVAEDSILEIGDDVLDMKAIFIYNKNTYVVIAYDIFINTIPITNQMIFEKDLIICRG